MTCFEDYRETRKYRYRQWQSFPFRGLGLRGYGIREGLQGMGYEGDKTGFKLIYRSFKEVAVPGRH